MSGDNKPPTPKITHSTYYRNAPTRRLFPAKRLRLWTGKDGNERAQLFVPRFSPADGHEAAAGAIQAWVIERTEACEESPPGFRSPRRRDRHLFLRHRAKVEWALPGAVQAHALSDISDRCRVCSLKMHESTRLAIRALPDLCLGIDRAS
jgi:hypothetical protein